MPTVLVTGATGFLGRFTCLALARRGWEVQALSRSPARVRASLGAIATAVTQDTLPQALARADVVLHLAGEPVFPGRWTEARRAELLRSRAGLGDTLVAGLRPGAAYVTASAVGFYGDRGAEEIGEDAPAGTGYLAELCSAWEAPAHAAAAKGAREVRLRIGIVLGPGGFLERVLPLTRLGLGGALGSGDQYVPWIHLEDVVAGIVRAVGDSRVSGAYNLTAPEPVPQRELAAALAQVVHRWMGPPAPELALRGVFGEAAEAILGGQRALPRRLLAEGFSFRFPTVLAALENVVAVRGVTIGDAPAALPSSPYLATHGARRRLVQELVLDAPLSEVFPFFSRPENLAALTPPSVSFRLLGEPPADIRAGTEIDHAISLGGVPLTWRTHIERFEVATDEALFVDTQTRGPYQSWWHEHRYIAEGARTRVRDQVWFSLPLGAVGNLVAGWGVEAQLQTIFGFRAWAMAARFGVV